MSVHDFINKWRFEVLWKGQQQQAGLKFNQIELLREQVLKTEINAANLSNTQERTAVG